MKKNLLLILGALALLLAFLVATSQGQVSQVSGGASSPLLSTSIFVATNGNDATAVRGNSGLPYRTVGAALTAGIQGDSIVIGPGQFTNDTFAPKASSKLVGAGSKYTFLVSPLYLQVGDDTWFYLSNNVYLEGFTLGKSVPANFAKIYPIVDFTHATNCVMRDVTVVGDSDTLGLSGGTTLKLYNCTLIDQWDGQTLHGGIDATINGTNGLVEYFNCTFILGENTTAHSQNGGTVDAIASGTANIYGGTVIYTNLLGGSVGIAFNGGITSNPNQQFGWVTICSPVGFVTNNIDPTASALIATSCKINGHPYPDTIQFQYGNVHLGDVTNMYDGSTVPFAGAVISENSNGDRIWSFDASTLTNTALTVQTNSTAPSSTTIIRAWINVTNNLGKVGKTPIYY